MTDPTRLIEEAGGDELESSLLQLARTEGPSTDGRRKILAAIAAASATSLATQTAHAAGATSKSMTIAKWSVLAVMAVAIPAAVLLRNNADETTAANQVPSALKAPASEVKATPVAPPAAAEPEGPAPVALEDLPTLPSETPASGAIPGAKPQQGSLADEVAQRFPRPMLGAEATVLRIEALSQSGDAARAKTLAEAFLAKYPNSPYATRLRSLTGAR
jgi:hypothetical protein